MPKTHWKKLQNPDYLGAYALEPGQELVLTIRSVVRENVTGPDGKKEDCTVAHFQESVKPMILNTTNSKIIEKLYKTPYIEEWAGKKIQIFSAQVKAFGDVVDALRIRPFIPKPPVNGAPVCSDCENPVKAFDKYSAAAMAEYTTNKYGRPLCSDCAKKAQEQQQKAVDPLASQEAKEAETAESGAAE